MSNEIQKKENYCGNCGEEGHTYRRCLAPIMSLGVILYKVEDNQIKYLMVQRRDTLGFVEFMRGKYNLENSKYIFELFKIMTESERIKILNNDFDYLWQNLWMNKIARCALVEINVDYTAAGSVSTFYNGAPTHINMTLTFQEMELITQEFVDRGY